MSASCFVTYAASTFTFFFFKSGASNEISSRTFSKIVCKRRAPIFSVCSFTVVANFATVATASSVIFSLMPSVSSSATYCLLSAFHRNSCHLIHIEQFALFFLNQVFERIRDRHLPPFLLLPEHAAEHVLQIYVHLLHALVGDDFERRHLPLAHFNVHHALVELSFTQLRAKLFTRTLIHFALGRSFAVRRSRRRRRRWRQQQIQHP